MSVGKNIYSHKLNFYFLHKQFPVLLIFMKLCMCVYACMHVHLVRCANICACKLISLEYTLFEFFFNCWTDHFKPFFFLPLLFVWFLVFLFIVLSLGTLLQISQVTGCSPLLCHKSQHTRPHVVRALSDSFE